MNRKFNWVSSTNPDNFASLEELSNSMIKFYSQPTSRDQYQEMVNSNDNNIKDPGLATTSFINYVKGLDKKSFLEVGCGSGRIYQFIQKNIENIKYTGLELSEKVIENNKKTYPDSTWHVGNTYNIPMESESVDICFSFYVLEHLVYPEKALIEMLRVVKKGGYLILIFPDFVSSGRLASQRIGLSNIGSAKEKLKKGKVLDTLISLYDSKIRLPIALKNSNIRIGAFPINITPKCLDNAGYPMSPDIDAVYIASKEEIKNWAKSKNLNYSFPSGIEEYFSLHTFISIKK